MSSDKFAVKIENTIRIFQKPLKYVKAQKVTIYKAILLFFTLLFSDSPQTHLIFLVY